MKTPPSATFLATLGAGFLALLPAGPTFALPAAIRATVPGKQTAQPAAIASDTSTPSTSTATTDPVGYASVALQANSDTLVSIPFTRAVEFTGAIASVNGSTITVSGSPGWATNKYVYPSGTQSNTYYAIIGPLLTSLANTVSVTNGSTTVTGSGFTPIAQGDEILVNGLAYNVASVTNDTTLVLARAYTGTTASGLSTSYNHSPKEGSYYTVTANGTNTLTVTLNGDSLSTVAAGTSVSLIPYWTLGTAFPVGDAGKSYVASTGTGPRSYQTEIMLPDLITPGINLSASAAYINYGSKWCLEGTDGTTSSDDVLIPPTGNLTVRNGATATTFVPTGGVYMNRVTAVLDTQVTSAQDNAVSLPRPMDVSLNDLGLVTKTSTSDIGNGFVISNGISPRSIKDTLLLYDNVLSGVNKASPASYFYYNGGWRLEGSDGTVDYGDTVKIPGGSGFIIRKVSTSTGASSFVQNTRSY